MKNKMKTLCLGTALMVSMGIAHAQVKAEHYTTKKMDFAIFPAEYPTDLDGTAYTPSHSDVDKAEAALLSKLKDTKCKNKDDMHEIVKNLDKYKVQVFGYKDKDGHKYLFLNCFRNDKDRDKEIASTWLSQMVQVEDGGDYFWTIKYDVGKDQLFTFAENGNG